MQPAVGWQPSVVHALPSLQTGGVPGAQTPLWQVSMPSQTSVPPQAMPFTTAMFRQPSMGLHESLVHGLASSQSTGSLMQRPPSQRSAVVHALPSAQSASITQQPAIGVLRQPFGGPQVSAVQSFSSSQSRSDGFEQLPP